MMMTSRTSVLTLDLAPQNVGGYCLSLNRYYDPVVPSRAAARGPHNRAQGLPPRSLGSLAEGQGRGVAGWSRSGLAFEQSRPTAYAIGTSFVVATMIIAGTPS